MAFLSGTVSFSRFEIAGGAPKRLDDRLLEKLRARQIGRQSVASPDNVETGWIGGRHLLDGEFDLEKNILLECLHFGMRVDSRRIPPELLRAYVQMELDDLRSGNGNGRVTPRMKKEAHEAARNRAAREINEGRYLRLRQFPILLDSRDDVLYVSATQSAVLDRLYPLFKETFGRQADPLTAGSIAYRWAEARGLTRRLETMKPARFVQHADGNGRAAVYWTAHDAASRDFLGNEFLLWLWYRLAEESDTIALGDKTEASVLIVRQLTLECPRAETGKETITCEGPAQLPESRRAIQSGKLPRKAGLILSRQGAQYELTLQAETFNVSGAVLPPPETNGNGNLRARYEERIEQIRHLGETVDLLFGAFLERRLSPDWPDELEKVVQWLQSA